MQLIDSVIIGGKKHKRIMFDSLQYEEPEIWIEGIGSLCGIVTLEKAYAFEPPNSYELLCLKDCDSTIFINTNQKIGDGECFFASYIYSGNINENKTETLSIYPNPLTNISAIKLKNFNNSIFNKVEIIDINGRMIMTRKMVNDVFYIKRSDFTSGIYLCRITNNSQGIISKCFIVQ